MTPKRFVFAAFAALGFLTACGAPSGGPSVSRAPDEAFVELPSSTFLISHYYVHAGMDAAPRAAGGQAIRVKLKPMYKGYDPREGPPGRLIHTPSATLAQQTANMLERWPAAHTVARNLGVEIARSTHCRSGAIRLAEPTRDSYRDPAAIQAILAANNGQLFQPNVRIPKGIQKTVVPPVNFTQASGVWEVNLICEAPSPYGAATQRASTIAASQRPQGTVVTQSAKPSAENAPGPFRQRAAGNTYLAYTKSHGPQVYYLSPDGKVHLWYPGNRRAVQGRWIVEPLDRNAAIGVICFTYQNARNPVSGYSGGRSCETAPRFFAGNREAAAGDPFGLATGRIPFVLGKKPTSLADLARQS